MVLIHIQICRDSETCAVFSMPPMTFRPSTQSATTLFWSPTPTVLLSNQPSKLRDSSPGLDYSRPQSSWPAHSHLSQTQSSFSAVTVPGLGAARVMLWGPCATVMREKSGTPQYSGAPGAELSTVHNKGKAWPRKLLMKTKVLTHTLNKNPLVSL